MQNFDSNCADFYKEIEKLKADIVEINDCSQRFGKQLAI